MEELHISFLAGAGASVCKHLGAHVLKKEHLQLGKKIILGHYHKTKEHIKVGVQQEEDEEKKEGKEEEEEEKEGKEEEEDE